MKTKIQVFCIILLFIVPGCRNKNTTNESIFDIGPVQAMSTIINFRIVCSSQEQALSAANSSIREIERLELIFSAHNEQSELYKVNQIIESSDLQDFPVSIQVSEELFTVIKDSLPYCEMTNGAFDITIKNLLDLWGFARNPSETIAGRVEHTIPNSQEIENLANLHNYRNIRTNDTGSLKEIIILKPGFTMDLGAVSKGYITDKAMEKIKEFDFIKSGLMEAGGDIYFWGRKPDGTKWSVGIKNPRYGNENRPGAIRLPSREINFISGELLSTYEGVLAEVVYISDYAVVSSGDYERYFIKDGELYHHIIDPVTGYPAHGCISVSVTAPDAMTADILSTAIFVMGWEKGMELANRLDGIEAFIIYDTGISYQKETSSGWDSLKDKS